MKIDSDRDQRIVELYRKGESSVTIGRRLGMTPSGVLKALRRLNVPTRSAIDAGQLREAHW